MLKKLVLPALTSLALLGCVNNVPVTTTYVSDSNIISMAKSLVADQLRDPEATKFKEDVSVYLTSAGDYIACGTLNGKNAMGGYVGYKPFYARIRNGRVERLLLPSPDDKYGFEQKQIVEVCNKAATGSVNVSS